jgi:hypothetical protein
MMNAPISEKLTGTRVIVAWGEIPDDSEERPQTSESRPTFEPCATCLRNGLPHAELNFCMPNLGNVGRST